MLKVVTELAVCKICHGHNCRMCGSAISRLLLTACANTKHTHGVEHAGSCLRPCASTWWWHWPTLPAAGQMCWSPGQHTCTSHSQVSHSFSVRTILPPDLQLLFPLAGSSTEECTLLGTAQHGGKRASSVQYSNLLGAKFHRIPWGSRTLTGDHHCSSSLSWLYSWVSALQILSRQ